MQAQALSLIRSSSSSAAQALSLRRWNALLLQHLHFQVRPSSSKKLKCHVSSRLQLQRGFFQSRLGASLEHASDKITNNNKIHVVEHIVLLRVKEGVSEEQTEAMVSAIRGLKSLPTVVHLTAGKNTSGGVGTDAFTHALHSRYYSKEDLESYANDPLHLEVINKYISPIVDDRIALDWETQLDDTALLSSSSVGAVRLLAMKPHSHSAPLVSDFLAGFQTRFPSITQVSFGMNFSPRSKGYELGFLAILPNPQELSTLSANVEYMDVFKSSIFPALEKYTIVDYSST